MRLCKLTRHAYRQSYIGALAHRSNGHSLLLRLGEMPCPEGFQIGYHGLALLHWLRRMASKLTQQTNQRWAVFMLREYVMKGCLRHNRVYL